MTPISIETARKLREAGESTLIESSNRTEGQK